MLLRLTSAAAAVCCCGDAANQRASPAAAKAAAAAAAATSMAPVPAARGRGGCMMRLYADDEVLYMSFETAFAAGTLAFGGDLMWGLLVFCRCVNG